MMVQCKICHEYKFSWKEHKCNPIFEILHEDYNGDEWMEQRGFDFEDAAKKYAEDYNTEGDLMNDEIDIKVKNPETQEIKTITIGAEPDIFYSVKIKGE